MDNKKLGQLGEDIACDYLKKKGYKILDRNYVKIWDDKTKGEIDIVAKPKRNIWDVLFSRGNTIHFIEVKTAVFGNDFYPEEKVDYKKQKKLKKLAEIWLRQNKISFDSEWQIDVAGILIDENGKNPKIHYFENVVEA